MARKTNLYRAYIVENDELKDIEVDIFDLPYDRFSSEKPLIIRDDVMLGRSKGRAMPNMKSVVFTKTLNFGDFRIMPDTVLPDEVPTLICDHAINSMDDLPKKLPSKLQQISIRHALLNNIKKDKDGELASARRFVQSHPRIIVGDGEITLHDLLKDIERENLEKRKAQPAEKKSKKNIEMAKKTDDYYSTDEMIVACRVACPELGAFSDEDLARYIKQARSVKAGLKLNPMSLKRADGTTLVCVHRDYLGVVVDFIRLQIASDAARANKEKTTKSSTSASLPVVENIPLHTEPVYHLDGRTFKTSQIKKYIPKRQWNIIRSACGSDKKQLLEILREIDVINVNPADTTGSKVYYIQDGQIKVARTLEFKSARCLAQGFRTLNSRQRIVWAVSGNMFVCIEFFPEHEHTLHKYKMVIRNIDFEAKKIGLSDCYDVADLIRELSSRHDAEIVPEAPKKLDVDVDVSDISNTSELKMGVEHQAAVPETYALQTVTPQQKSETGNGTQKTVTNIEMSSDIIWAELCSMNAQLTQQINMVDNYRQIVINKMQVETNTDKLLILTEEMMRILRRKKELEEMTSKLHEMNQMLKGWQTCLNRQK